MVHLADGELLARSREPPNLEAVDGARVAEPEEDARVGGGEVAPGGANLPELAPAADRQPWSERNKTLLRAMPLVAIVFIVLGGIYLGWFTPVEAASIGAMLTLGLTIVRGKFTFAAMTKCVLETIKTFAFVYLIVIGAFIFNPFLADTRLPSDLAEFIGGLKLAPVYILLLIVLVYIILGTFLEGRQPVQVYGCEPDTPRIAETNTSRERELSHQGQLAALEVGRQAATTTSPLTFRTAPCCLTSSGSNPAPRAFAFLRCSCSRLQIV